MLYVFLGTDTTKVRSEAFEFIETLQDEKTEANKVTSESYSVGMVSELAQGADLFGGNQIIVFDTPSENKEVDTDIFSNLELMQESTNNFVVIEGSCDAEKKKKIKKYAEKVCEVTGEKKERFNVFALTDAFSRRDKKSLWLLLSAAWREGISNEEIIGILFWQIKILRLVSKTKSADEAGQKPFVYQKAKKALANFKEGEIDELSKSLLTIYHEGHLGKVDLNYALERWVLSI